MAAGWGTALDEVGLVRAEGVVRLGVQLFIAQHTVTREWFLRWTIAAYDCVGVGAFFGRFGLGCYSPDLDTRHRLSA